jgi:hypothetical protein
MGNYYFVGTLLPSLSFETSPEISFEEFETLLRDNLTTQDYDKTKTIRIFYDILNLRALWMGEELDPRGEYDETELEDALFNCSGLPDYVYDYIDAYEKQEDLIKYFPKLMAKLFQNAASIKDSFLQKYMQFERELRLILVGFRAKKLGWDLASELQFEDPEEELIAQMLAQKDAKEFTPPEKFDDLKKIFSQHRDDPLAFQKALDQYRFDEVEGMVDFGDNDSMQRILAYMIQLFLVEKWHEMDKLKGKEIVEAIIK